MGDFSAGRAIGAGFGLIGRQPLAFLAWTLVFLVVGVGPQVAVFSAILPVMSRLTEAAQAAAQSNTEMSPAEMMRLQATALQLQPIGLLGSLASQTLVLGAVYRAMLFPEDRAFLYLRISMREVWLGLVLAVLVVMAFIGFFAAMIPTMIVTGVVAAVGRDSGIGVLLVLAAVTALFGVMIWLALRLSLATPMSFAEQNFRVFESWAVTAGRAGKMFAVGLALVVIVWVSEMILLAAGFAVVTATVGFETIAGWFEHPHPLAFAAMAPWMIGAFAIGGVLSTFFLVLFGAAWAEIYKGLEAGVERPVGVAR
jgi:hypothetical protein